MTIGPTEVVERDDIAPTKRLHIIAELLAEGVRRKRADAYCACSDSIAAVIVQRSPGGRQDLRMSLRCIGRAAPPVTGRPSVYINGRPLDRAVRSPYAGMSERPVQCHQP